MKQEKGGKNSLEIDPSFKAFRVCGSQPFPYGGIV